MTMPTSADLAPPAPEDQVGLDWLLAQAHLGLVPLHVARTVDGPVRVSWVHAVELEDPTPWLRPGGLVLTTGLRLARSRDLQAAYVARLRQAGAAGLGFGTGLRFASVPTGVVDACRAQDLSLVEVPLPTPFLAVTQAVSDRISQQRRWRVQEVLDAQRALTRAALRGGSAAVVSTLARLLRSGVHLVDADRVTVAVGGDTSGQNTETQPLGPTGARAGWLTLVRLEPLSPRERLVLNHALSLMALDLVHRQEPLEEDAPPLLAALLAGHGSDPLSVLAAMGFVSDDPVTLIGMRAADPPHTPTVVGRLRRALGDVHLYGSGPHGGPDRFLLVPTSRATIVEAVLVRAATARAQSVTLVVGTPTPLDQAALGLPGVVRALETASHSGDVHVVRLAESSIQALLPPDAWAALGEAAAPWIALIAAYDRHQDTVLGATLATFLRHHGRADPASRELGIHRHTLRHRLARAEKIAGFDLGDPTHRALLLLAIQRPRASTLAP